MNLWEIFGILHNIMLKLKEFILDSPVIQSPMAGCTDLAFRIVARERGMGLCFLEMISADALVRENKKTLLMMRTTEKDRPLGAQLVGNNPEVMADAAEIIEEMGFDVLDINCGCPVPKITAPGGGSALLLEPEKSKKIFSAVAKRVKKIPLTVKMRKGYADASGEEGLRLAQMAEESGCNAVTIHGRTRAQGYSGKADWEAIGKIKKALRIPVIGNGDVVDGKTAKELLEVSGCDAIMIGRGGLGNPWIYKSIQASLEGRDEIQPSLEEKKQAALRHLELEIESECEKVAVLRFRKIASWYFKDMPGSAKLRARINLMTTAEEMRQAVREFGMTEQV